MNTQYLFVYGTLRSDVGSHWHQRLIAPNFTLVCKADIPGKLYSLGEYPGLVECPASPSLVQGEVYSFNADMTSLEALDEYEGCSKNTPIPHEYKRVQVTVALKNGTEVQAWCYYYLGDAQGFEPIPYWA